MVYWQLANDPDPQTEIPSWLAIEQSLPQKTSLRAILFSSPRPRASCKGEHYTINNAQKIWTQIRKFCELPETSVHAPIWRNHAFLPSNTDAVFKEWSRKGIGSIKDLYVDKHLCSFEILQIKYNLPKSNFFRYLQLRHYIRQNISSSDPLPEENSLFKLLLGPPEAKGLISKLVCFFSHKHEQPDIKFKQMWEDDLNISIQDEIWKQALNNIHHCSVNARLQLIQFKVIHRLHYSKVKLHKIFPQTSPLCERCKRSDGTLAHQFWLCPEIQDFWCSIFRWYSHVLKVNLDPDPETALLGISNTLDKMGRNVSTVVAYGIVIAKRCILRVWKSDLPPKFEAWLRELVGILYIEKLRYEISGNLQKFCGVWRPILEYLKL